MRQAILVIFAILVNSYSFSQTGDSVYQQQEEKLIYAIVEQMPEFPGGKEALSKFIEENTRYPVTERNKGMEGTVYVTFVVSPEGKTYDARILRGIEGGPGFSAEAMRVVGLMPDWEPGKQRGIAVDVQYTIPIMFILDGTKQNENSVKPKKKRKPNPKKLKIIKPSIDKSELKVI